MWSFDNRQTNSKKEVTFSPVQLTPCAMWVPLPHYQPKCLDTGVIYYTLGNEVKTRQQAFKFDHEGLLGRREIDVIARIGEALEYRHKGDRLRVVSMRLPKSGGFSGSEHGYYSVKKLFPSAGIRLRRHKTRAGT